MAIIAISRQVGSWGDEIAALTAKQLDYELVGRDEIHALAETCDAEFKDACALYESEIPRGFWERHFFKNPSYTSLFEALTCELAARGNVVILGRGAQIVLGELSGVLKVRIVAPTKARVQRIMERERLTPAEAQGFVHRYDHQRRALIQSIYSQDLSNWALYDMVLNTAALKPEAAAGIILRAVETMDPAPDEEALKEGLRRTALAKRVESAIRKKVDGLSYQNIEVESPSPGRVVLNGLVQDKADADLARRIAEGFKELTEVDDRIRTMGSSFFKI
ncbi:MAG: cytidylate kinase family protein [Proteobacteria bacterium]|nr:cytidylate kinase family protein [Pseudomonadota bacterium]